MEAIPELTARIAKAAFPKGNPYLTLRDHLGILFQDESFSHLFSRRGQPAEAPWRRTLVTIMSFVQDLSDVQAADAVRSRLDWKYALSLDLEDPGFDASVLCEFRARLLQGDAEKLLLDTLLAWCREKKLLKAGGNQHTDSTHVLAAVRTLNRSELVLETMRAALDALALAKPTWLLGQLQPEWEGRYIRWAQIQRLPQKPEERQHLALTVGQDGVRLLQAIYAADAPQTLRQLSQVQILRRIWVQNYQQVDSQVQWRETGNLPPAAYFLSSPHDVDAHLARKGDLGWIGYKVHLTETCEEQMPPLITHVETTAAPTADTDALPAVYQALQNKDLLPKTHLVDTGYVDAALLVSSQQEFGVDLLGPPRPNLKWQAQEKQGFDLSHFTIDWDNKQATCPEGQVSRYWDTLRDNRGTQVLKIKFASKTCRVCPKRSECIRSQAKAPRRTLTVRLQEQHEALQQARKRMLTKEYAREYARRAGIEGTLSRGVRTCGMRCSRYVGLAKVHLGNVLTALAINVLRLGEWLSEAPQRKPRQSPFSKLIAANA